MPRLSKIGAAALAAFGWTSGNAAVSASYLVIAGGGGGYIGGGGAGGFLTGTTALNPTLSYTVTVGAGGATNVNGGNSVFNAITAIGGGGGAAGGAANSGGSGGGGSYSSGAGGAGTSGQGNAGGTGSASSGGGGGGAGAVGGNGSGSTGGNGGAGTTSSISGASVTYAGGGGGSCASGTSSGGSGGGGNGSYNGSGTTGGTANTGGGGGGAQTVDSPKGGSGVVIISYPGAQQFGGGNVTSSGGNTIHTFTTSGTLSPLSSLTAQYLIVAGGGGGGGAVNDYTVGGGGGAGGLLTNTGVTIDTNSNYVVTVGAGGAGGTYNALGSSGGNSAWSIVSTTALGGGVGSAVATAAATSGGSGGGGGSSSTPAGGSGTSGQGNAGGTGLTFFSGAGNKYGAGGGGAGAVGSAGSGGTGGAGGVGVASSISGTSTYYAGGGGGAGTSTGGAGGNGGGGAGVTYNNDGTAGTAYTGGGGGGAARNNAAGTQVGGNGGSGIVIISYPGSTQQMAGGTVTISGGNVIHTFTSSGYLTPIKYASRSLRTRASASAYLNRTFGSTGNTKTWTWSGWVKRGVLGTKQNLFGQVDLSVTNRQCYVSFETDNTLSFRNYTTSGYDYQLFTTQVFRDPSAWYHLVIVSDTTQATSTNRLKIYVNGAQVTAFGTASYPSQNFDGWINANAGSGVQLGIGRAVPYNTTEYVDGYFAEVNFVDGAALTPSSFGTFNSYGVWQPITYGGSYGTNGFYLTFGNNTSTTTLGYDTSPQGNNWTTNNISLTAGATYDSMLDVPTLTSATAANYCTYNPLDFNSNPTISNGNLQIATTGTGNPGAVKGTLGVSTGKWYWEITQTAGAARGNVGIILASTQMTQFPGNYSTAYIYNGIAGNKYNNGTATAYGASYTAGDVIGVALDMDAGTIVFYKNNSSQGTAFTGLSGIFTPVVSDTGGGSGAFAVTLVANFGQQPFTYTPPSGYVALNTYNLSTPTIPNGAVYMAATTYTGNGSTQSIVNTVNGTVFQPDWVWIKKRSAAAGSGLFDVIRGAGVVLTSNTTDAERNNGTGSGGDLIAFNSNGFNLGNNTTGSAADTNLSGGTYVGWQWKANGTGVSNTSGSITSTVSANTTAGFSVVTYTGNGTSGATVGHGLGVTPNVVIVKSRSASGSWPTYTTPVGNSATLLMDTTDAAGNYSGSGYPRNPSSTTFELYFTSTGTNSNANGTTYVAYCFAAVAGFSAVGSYTGNGSTDGPFVYTGFRPRFVLIKCSSNTTASTVWTILDTSRNPYNAAVNQLYPNSNVAEDVDSSGIDILSNGFKPKRNSEYANLSGWTYIYIAFAENPFKYANAR